MKRFVLTVVTVTLFLFIVGANHSKAEEAKTETIENSITEPVVTIEDKAVDTGIETKKAGSEMETGTDSAIAETTETASEVNETPEADRSEKKEGIPFAEAPAGQKEMPVAVSEPVAIDGEAKPENTRPEEDKMPAAVEQALKPKKEKEKSPWRLRGRSETIVEWKDYNYPESTVDKDTRWRQELSAGISRKIKNGNMGLDIRGRATDDENIDDKDARLLYLNGYYRTKNATIELGDVAASFNPLVMSASLKGTKLNYRSDKSDKGWETSFLGGIQKASWDDIYGKDETDAYDRYIAGIHHENTFGAGRTLTVSSAFITDSDNSSSDDSTRIYTNPAEAVTLGTSWDWRFNRYFTTRGEAAITHSDENTDESGSAETAGAVRIKLMTKPLKKYLRSNFLYERIETDFKPFIASVAADREKFQNDSTIMVNRKVKIRITLKENRDNLDGELDGTLITDDGVFYLTLRPDWLKRGDFGLRNQFKRTHGRGTDQRINIHQLDFSVRPNGGWKYGLSWIFTDINEKTVDMEDQDIHTVRTTVGWNKRFSNDHLFRSTFRLDGNFIERDSGRQRTAGGKVDLGYDAGKYLSADLSAGTNKTYRDAADDGKYTSYEIRGSYHPFGDRSKAIRLSASKRQTYIGSETTSTENTAKLSYLFSF